MGDMMNFSPLKKERPLILVLGIERKMFFIVVLPRLSSKTA
jgi:hypothetical protein